MQAQATTQAGKQRFSGKGSRRDCVWQRSGATVVRLGGRAERGVASTRHAIEFVAEWQCSPHGRRAGMNMGIYFDLR
jgi:hypothetical protein